MKSVGKFDFQKSLLKMINQSYIIDEMEVDKNNKKAQHKKRSHTFEETVSKLGTGKFHIFILFVCGSSVLSSVNEGLSIGFVLPYVKCDLQMSSTEQGLLNSAGFIGVILSSHFWGFMADTWGRKKVMQLSVFTAFIFSACSSVANHVWLMIGLRFIVGLFVSGVQSSGIAYLGEFHSDRTRSKHITFTAMFSTLSIVYMALIGWLVIPAEWQTTLFGMAYKPWRLFILTSSCVNIFAFVGLLFMPESPKFLLAMGKREEALDIIKNVYQINTGNPKESFPVTEIELQKLGSNLADAKGLCAILRMMWTQTKPLFMKPLVWNLARMSYLSFSLFGIAHGFYMWYPEILSIFYKNSVEPVTICGAISLSMSTLTNSTTSIETIDPDVDAECVVINSSTTYPIFVVMGTTFAVLYTFAAMCMQHIGRRLLLSMWLILSCSAATALVFTTDFYVIQAFVILLCSCGNCGSILTAISADLFPTRYKGMALCIIMIAARFGAVVGNNVLAALLFNTCDSIFFMFIGFLASSVLVFITIPTKPQNFE